MTRPTTEELARRALETVARAHGVPVSDVHAAVRRAAEHTEALGALTPEELVAYLAHRAGTGSRNGSRFFCLSENPNGVFRQNYSLLRAEFVRRWHTNSTLAA
ncbi:MAG: hypothetical protein ACLTR5_06290 [Oscillospiraceae bacterium]